MTRRSAVTVLCAFLLAAAGPLGGQEQAGGYVNFTFDQVDVRNFVKLVGEITGDRFVVNNDVDGKITVVSPKIPVKDVFTVFVSILESVGCSVVKESDGAYRVVSIASRPSAPVVGAEETTPESGMVCKIIRLKHVSAGEMQKALEGKVKGGKEGSIAAIETTNHLLITDTAENVRRIEKIVEEVDRPGLSRTTEVLALKNANSEDIAEQLTRAMGGSVPIPGGGRYARAEAARRAASGDESATIVAAPHSNSLILVGTPSQIEELKRIVAMMDVESPSGGGRLHAIFLKYTSAEEAAKSLNALLTGVTADKSGGGTVAMRSSTKESNIAIEPHAANNALLVDSSPVDFEWVSELINQLDKPLEQVLIEIMIAEVSMNDSLNVGAQLAVVDVPSKQGETVVMGSSVTGESASDLMQSIQSGILPRGLSVGLAHGGAKDADGNVTVGYPGIANIDAVRQKGKFRVLSNVPLLAQNNKEASVSIVNNVPMLKSTISGGTGTSRDVIQNIDRVDVGIKLKLTPHVNPGREVVMTLNPSIEAVISAGPVENNLAPTVARREISTTVTVPDGETIVLSGLMREDQTETVRKVPILGSIPLIGWLFRRTAKGVEKTNLLVFVTPHVVTDPTAAREMTAHWQERTSLSNNFPGAESGQPVMDTRGTKLDDKASR